MTHIDTSVLIASGRKLVLPATCAVHIDAPEDVAPQLLELLEALRVLPNKRVVCLARWQGKLVVAKLFFAQGRWSQHLEREERGIRALQNSGVKTAELLVKGKLIDARCGFLLLHYIDRGESLGARFDNSASAARELLLTRIVSVIADCHARGIMQRDIHLDNFLLRNDEIFVLDAGELERQSGGIDAHSSMRNLALFLAQFPAHNDGFAAALHEHYRQQRPQIQWRDDTSVFLGLLRDKRVQRLQLVLKKLYRETSAHALRCDWKKFVVYERHLESPELQSFIRSPDEYIARGKIIKDGRSATVALVEIAGQKYVLKRYNIKSFWHRWRRQFRPSRAWVCWRNAHMLEMLGVATAKPLLMFERRFGPLRREAYFLCAYVPGEDALHFLRNEPKNWPAQARVIEQFRSVLRTFRDYSIVHGDMKATNFHISDKGIVVLDLDGMYQELNQQRFTKARAKDLQRFAKNWDDSPMLAQQINEMLQRLQEESDYFTKGS